MSRNSTIVAFEKSVNTVNKELYLVDGASHIQTYWKEPYVTQKSEKLIEFFGQYLD